jgi:cyclopropane-fatty-acyl-phospholipid synthase
MAEYFTVLRGLLHPRGRLLNHAISSVHGSRLPRRSFTYRYVFPDGELIDVGEVALAMQRAGFEVRDVESLREHYALTLRRWVTNLESSWDRAVALTTEGRARVWRLYMAGSALSFEAGRIGVNQVLAVRPGPGGASGLPRTRDLLLGT